MEKEEPIERKIGLAILLAVTGSIASFIVPMILGFAFHALYHWFMYGWNSISYR